jgi:hypothetical protein
MIASNARMFTTIKIVRKVRARITFASSGPKR